MPLPRLYKFTLLLSVIGLLLSLINVATRGAYSEAFGWLFFYIPFLWVLWTCCVFFVRIEKILLKLLYLWIVIDSAALLLFISFAMNVSSWSQARGVEIVVATTYFPVVIPTAFLLNFVPTNAEPTISKNLDYFVKFFGGGAGDAFAIWLGMSCLAAIQSLGLVVLSRFFVNRKRK